MDAQNSASPVVTAGSVSFGNDLPLALIAGPCQLESRVYRCIPGRLPALLKRFENVTLKLWEKHAIRPVGFFTTLIGESNQELTYFLAWESLAERETKWTAFQSDPDWISARAKSEEDGQIIQNIVSQLLVPTAFSALK